MVDEKGHASFAKPDCHPAGNHRLAHVSSLVQSPPFGPENDSFGGVMFRDEHRETCSNLFRALEGDKQGRISAGAFEIGGCRLV